MNIFITSKCPVESARNLDDKRVTKMCLETAQMLCTALNTYGVDTPYKSTHLNHPCNVWARASMDNWLWLYDHGVSLCLEYTARYGRRHKCQDIIENLHDLHKCLPSIGLTEFANCARNKSLGIDYTHLPTTTAYAIEYTTDQDLNTDRFTSYDYVESELQEEYTPRRERSGAV